MKIDKNYVQDIYCLFLSVVYFSILLLLEFPEVFFPTIYFPSFSRFLFVQKRQCINYEKILQKEKQKRFEKKFFSVIKTA